MASQPDDRRRRAPQHTDVFHASIFKFCWRQPPDPQTFIGTPFLIDRVDAVADDLCGNQFFTTSFWLGRAESTSASGAHPGSVERLGPGIATPPSRRRADGVEVEGAVKFCDFHAARDAEAPVPDMMREGRVGSIHRIPQNHNPSTRR